VSSQQKRYSVIVHDKAAQMLYAHVQFVANVSIPAVRKLKNKLYEALTSLETMPFRCPVYRTHNTSAEYRQLLTGRYKIIFAVSEENMTVSIRYFLDVRQKGEL